MAKDLTQGRIMPMLIKFTIPLILGNIFQLTYNAVDSIIVGRFVGKEALAAVGICNYDIRYDILTCTYTDCNSIYKTYSYACSG